MPARTRTRRCADRHATWKRLQDAWRRTRFRTATCRRGVHKQRASTAARRPCSGDTLSHFWRSVKSRALLTPSWAEHSSRDPHHPHSSRPAAAVAQVYRTEYAFTLRSKPSVVTCSRSESSAARRREAERHAVFFTQGSDFAAVLACCDMHLSDCQWRVVATETHPGVWSHDLRSQNTAPFPPHCSCASSRS